MQTFADGQIEITAADFPSFLYESGTIYNPDDEVMGLFCGFLLV
jgi:predicted transcriptional regulator